MKTNGNQTIKIGMTVVYRGSWGHDAPKEAVVEGIELCECEGDKYGDPVDEVAIADVERSTFDLSDGHWCYGYQVVEVIGNKN